MTDFPTRAATATTPSQAPSQDFGLTRSDLLQATGQRLLCRLLHIPLYAVCTGMMRWQRGYRFKNLAGIRRKFQEICETTDGPLVICGNHLTFIDSALMIWAFGSNSWYLRNFSRFSWNLPAGDFFKKRVIYRFVALISKCVFIHRDGSKQHKDSVLTLCRHLVQSGETVTIFPEGRRSRTGRFDPTNLTYGIGKLVTELGGARVLCVYLRGDKQDGHTNFPAKDSRFHLDMKVVDVVPRRSGREGYADVVSQVGATIKGMEDRYFAELRGRTSL